MSFINKTVFITGAGAGIGKALALQFAEMQAMVIAVDIDADSVARTVQEIRSHNGRATSLILDVRDSAAVDAAIDRCVADNGFLDYLICCAGISIAAEIKDMQINHFHDVADVNLYGYLHCALKAYTVMRSQKSGHIIAISSAAGLFAQPLASAYTLSKHAINGFFSCLAIEAAYYGINVSLICPGYVDTEIFEHALMIGTTSQNVRKEIKLTMMTPAQAAAAIIKAIQKKKKIAVFPLHAKIFYLLHRISPSFTLALLTSFFRRFKISAKS